jgi:tRNA A-37 threonylcarbamoyl transferase component Bud32
MATKAPVNVLLVIRDFQARLMNYVMVIDERNVITIAVDEWVFERDVDRGFLGEALSGRLIFAYTPLVNEQYLRTQEIKLKKRLAIELLRNVVLDFPELSYDIYIKPEYFLYETLLSRARLFPPLIYDLMDFLGRDVKKRNIERGLHTFIEALKEIEAEKTICFSDGYVRVSKDFVDKVKDQKIVFASLFKPAQRALFNSLLSVFPKVLNALSQNRELFLGLQRLVDGKLTIVDQLEDPERFLFVQTATELVPFASRMDIEVFVRRMLSVARREEVRVEQMGGVLNDSFLITTSVKERERKIVVKRFKDWSSFKWFPLTIWSVGTRTFAVSARSRLERECAINQLLRSKGFDVPKLLCVNNAERLIFTEYIEGNGLDKAIRRIVESKEGGKMVKELDEVSRAGEIFARVHASGIALGDTKPENVIAGVDGRIYLLDFEQASRKGDPVWDVAEFLYYSGHYVSALAGTRPAELVAGAFIEGYLRGGGNAEVVKRAGNAKYTKVFSLFTLPNIVLSVANMCRRTRDLKG